MARNFSRFFILFLLIIGLTLALFACGKMPEQEPGTEETACEHDFSVFESVTEPTTTAYGEVKCVCSKCGASELRVLPMLSESGYTLRVTEATCTEDGRTEYVCEYGTFAVTTPKTGHHYTVKSERAATCTEKGETLYECTRCHDEYAEEIDVAEHAYQEIARREGDCDEGGETGEISYRCSTCGQVVHLSYKKPHNYDAGVHTDIPCGEGYTTYTCAECGNEKKVYDGYETHRFNATTGVCDDCGKACEHTFDGYVCRTCGLDIRMRVREDGFFLCDENANGEADAGEKVYFGFYPQSVVSKTDTALLSALDATTPTDGVYLVNGEKYVKIAVDQVRDGINAFSDGNPIMSYAEAYFLFEPVRWTVVKTEEDVSTLYSDLIVDVADFKRKGGYAYDEEEKEYFVTGGTAYADDWGASDIRALLNGDFLATLTAESGALLVRQTELNNDETGYYVTREHAHGATTTDSVYLPAYRDLYGEEDPYDEESEARMKTSSDYAKARGLSLYELRLRAGASPYYLRSAGRYSRSVLSVDGNGLLNTEEALYNEIKDGKTVDGVGFAPMVRIKTKE